MQSLGVKKSTIIQWLCSICLAGIFLVIPEQSFYTTQLKLFMAITIFCLALAAFELVPVIFYSILLPAFYAFFKVASVQVIMAPWLSTTFLLIVGALFMSASLEESGLLRRIAFYLMCKVKGSYFTLLIGLMLVSILMNIATSGNGYLIMAALATGLCVSLHGMQRNIGAGLAAAIILGGCTSHAYTYNAANLAVLTGAAGDLLPSGAITPLGIMLHNWPLLIVSVIILWIVSKFFKPEEELGSIEYFQEQLSAMGNLTKKEKVNAVMLCLVLLYIFTVNLHHCDLNLGFAIIPWLVYLPGLNGADEDTIKHMNFSVVFFVAGCMSIGTVATSLGLSEVIGNACSSALSGSTSPIMIMLVVFLIVFILNFLMTPLAIYALITVPVLTIALGMNFNPLPFIYAINACSEAILFPYEYVPYLLVYSFGMISMKDFIKVNLLRSILFFAGFIIVLVPYWKLIGLL